MSFLTASLENLIDEQKETADTLLEAFPILAESHTLLQEDSAHYNDFCALSVEQTFQMILQKIPMPF